MATHSSVLAWRIPGTGEPGGLTSMGLHRARHDWSDLAAAAFVERTDAEAEVPILSPPDAKNWLIGKDPDAGKDWRYKEKGMTEDKMFGWHHWLSGHEFEQAWEWWWTGNTGMLQPMGLLTVRHNWAIELNRRLKTILMNFCS